MWDRLSFSQEMKFLSEGLPSRNKDEWTGSH